MMIDVDSLMYAGAYVPWITGGSDRGGSRIVPYPLFGGPRVRDNGVMCNRDLCGVLPGRLKVVNGNLIQELKLVNRGTMVYGRVHPYARPTMEEVRPLFRAQLLGSAAGSYRGILLSVVRPGQPASRLVVNKQYSINLLRRVRDVMRRLGCSEDDSIDEQVNKYVSQHSFDELEQEFRRLDVWVDCFNPGDTFTRMVGYRHRCTLVDVLTRKEWDDESRDVDCLGEKGLDWVTLKERGEGLKWDNGYVLLFRLSLSPCVNKEPNGWNVVDLD